VNWLSRYHSNIIAEIERDAPLGSAHKLVYILPSLIGFGIFAVIDMFVQIGNGLRLPLLLALGVPGAIWFIYLFTREVQAFRRWHKGNQAAPKDRF
jgi:hypothetical protein